MDGMITQLTFLPDNERETVKARPSVPVAKCVGGRWCWLKFGTEEYVWEPELERVLLQALNAHERAA